MPGITHTTSREADTMRPVSGEFETSQNFGDMATWGVRGNVNAPSDTVEYWVGLYGDYQPYGHAGMDIACPIGTPIYAPADGTVLYAGWTEDLPGTGEIRQWLMYWNFGGILTAIQHDGWISFIAHQSNNDMVRPGQQVKEGQLIGYSGNTKTRATTVAAHVHCEALVYMDYRTRPQEGIIYGRVDPRPYFGAIAAMGGTTTPIEEDDMPLTDDDVNRIANAVHTRPANRPNGGTNTLEWSLGAESERTEGIIARTTEAVLRGIFATKFRRRGDGQSGDTDLGSVISWSDANFAHAGAASIGAAAGLNPEQVNAAIKAGLEAALAGTQATITLGGGK